MSKVQSNFMNHALLCLVVSNTILILLLIVITILFILVATGSSELKTTTSKLLEIGTDIQQQTHSLENFFENQMGSQNITSVIQTISGANTVFNEFKTHNPNILDFFYAFITETEQNISNDWLGSLGDIIRKFKSFIEELKVSVDMLDNAAKTDLFRNFNSTLIKFSEFSDYAIEIEKRLLGKV